MAGAFPPRSCEATIHETAHRVKPDGEPRGALDDDGYPKECSSPLIWLQASRAIARRRCRPSFGGIRGASGALARFGLDIGRGTSGWADGADAVRGHPHFLRET